MARFRRCLHAPNHLRVHPFPEMFRGNRPGLPVSGSQQIGTNPVPRVGTQSVPHVGTNPVPHESCTLSALESDFV